MPIHQGSPAAGMSGLPQGAKECFSAAIRIAEEGGLDASVSELETLDPALDLGTLRQILDVYYQCGKGNQGSGVRKTDLIERLHAHTELAKAMHDKPMVKRDGADSEPWAYIIPELAAIIGETITWTDVLKAIWTRLSRRRHCKDLKGPVETTTVELGAHGRVESPPPAAAYDVSQYQTMGPTKEDDSPSVVRGPSPCYSESVSAVHPFLRDTIEPAVASAFAAVSSAVLAVPREEVYVPPIDMPPRHFISRTELTVESGIVQEKIGVYEGLLGDGEGNCELPRTRSQTPQGHQAKEPKKKVRPPALRSHSAKSVRETTVPVGPSLLQRGMKKSHKMMAASLRSDADVPEEEASASFKARKAPKVRTVPAGGSPGAFSPIVVGSHQTHVAELEVRHRLGNTKTRPRRPDTASAAFMSASFRNSSSRGPLLERSSEPPRPFTARPVPWVVTAPMYGSLMSSKAKMRKKNRQEREAHFSRTASLPPRLQAREDASRRGDVIDRKGVLLSSRTADSVGTHTARVLTKALRSDMDEERASSGGPEYPRVSRQVPNFKALHKRQEKELRRRREMLARKITQPVPFSFTVARDELKGGADKDAEETDRKPRKKAVGPPSFVERDRKKEAERREKMKAEEEARVAAEKEQSSRPRSPMHSRVHQAVGPPAKPVGSEELTRRKKQQAKAAAQWRREVKRMLERVSRQPLLMDRVTLDASKERARQKALMKIKQELIAKKVTNWQSYFQTEELNILEMAELHELLGRGNKLDDDDYDDDHDDFEQEDPSRPGSEKSPASVGQREDNPHDVSSVQKAPSTPEVAEEITTEQEIIEEQVKENASEGSDIWVFEPYSI